MTVTNFELMDAFVTRWQNAGGKERANYQMFFAEFCDALGVERPNPQGGAIAYGFDHSMTIFTPSGKRTPGYIDFYKENHFVIEAKQGSSQSGKGTAKRGTQGYLKAMEGAFVQAVAYAKNLTIRPPFVLTCDIGSHFELWLGFGGDYGGYGARREIPLAELRKPETFALFVDIFTNPQARNPEKIAAIVTREVASDLADLAKSLERSPLTPLKKGGTGEDKRGTVEDRPQEVAQFLMRCIFTMFAEDVGLLKEQLFTDTLRDRWLQDPKSFKPGAEALWRAMNEGNDFGFYGKLLRFNGGLFANSTAFDLTGAQLEILLKAAQRDWRNVEPAIFGTLLERALESKERSKLGAHYTPRSYVERLVRPVVLEPLRDRWGIVQAEVNAILGDGQERLTERQISNRFDSAQSLLEGFLADLRKIRVLDPACGSGNFLYVTLDLMKQLESEVLQRLADVADVFGRKQMRLDIEQVNPSQFLGIELNPRAAAIADLVIWIGYLQWHFKRFGDIPPIEPVLREYNNIENRDAVLAWDGRVPDVDKDGKVRTRWGGRTMKSAVTGEDVPDATDQVTILKYINPRQAVWPEADYIVSNPPFIGNARMREMLGDGYSETLRKAYQDVPDTVDFVMYWWHKAADLVRNGKVDRFGFITMNTITQVRQRKVIDFHQAQKNSISLIFAIPDHPWADQGADVRIAMTAASQSFENVGRIAQLGFIQTEEHGQTPEESAEKVKIRLQAVPRIFSDLKSGADISSVNKLKSNLTLSCPGMKMTGAGFLITSEESAVLGYGENSSLNSIIKPYLHGRDIADRSRGLYSIDLFGLSIREVQNRYPTVYQWIYERVKPERDTNNRKALRENWWIYGEARATLRPALKNLNKYIVTIETAKHRTFLFLSHQVVPDNMLIAIALEDAYFLGVLSSKIHVTWALAAGGRLGVGNDPRYNKTVCFDPFPFPDPTEPQKQKIRDLGDRLDAHRKRVQAAHPEVTITAMYNLLEKLRKAEPLDDKDKAFNQKALVSTLKQIHDELDAAVFEAYGWGDLISRSPLAPLQKGGTGASPETNIANGSEVPLLKGDLGGSLPQSVDEQILDRLVKLNADRAEEERNGHIRWLRPEYQAPDQIQETQTTIAGLTPTDTPIPTPATQQKWPKDFKDQLAAIRDLLRTQGGEWSLDTIATQFKNATRSKPTIQTCLEALETLGLVAQHTENSKVTWYFAELQKAG
jgi:SAM-dependent methyltransferase